MAAAILLGGMATTAGCDRVAPPGPVRVSVIEAGKGSRDIAHPDDGMRLLVDATTGSGLLRLDEAGQLMPGIAARWTVIDDGPDGIFRIDATAGLSAPMVAGRLRRALARAPRWMRQDVQSVAAVTDSVVDVRLSAPRSALLTVFALPELATIGPGQGPMREEASVGAAVRLDPRASVEPQPWPVLLRSERVGRAIAGFSRGKVDLVLGGTFADLPVVEAAGLRAPLLRFDRAVGLFGLARTGAQSALADPRMLGALSLAINRDRLIAAIFGGQGIKSTTIAGSQYEPPLAERLDRARALVAAAGNPTAVPLRLLVPPGPGAHLLFALLAHDWAAVGVATVGAADRRDADLVLVDQVVPADERARAACAAAVGCDPADPASQIAPPFIPLAQPIRWSLVTPTLTLFTANTLAVHPLDRLRTPR